MTERWSLGAVGQTGASCGESMDDQNDWAGDLRELEGWVDKRELEKQMKSKMS